MERSSVFFASSSYRDPSGFIFEKDGIIYRQINRVFSDQFNHFVDSGCCTYLQKHGLLIDHEVIPQNLLNWTEHYTVLKPEPISFISFPYEWTFAMLKDAALLTLRLLKECIPFGVILKDASPYNIQWHEGRLIFIDTLSFERYDPSMPWIAYRQFCECFLSPLLLIAYTGQPLQSLLLTYADGIPLPLTKSLLPWHSRFSFHTYLHIHLHERLSRKDTDKDAVTPNIFSEKKLRRLIDSLESLIHSLHFKSKSSVWSNYYEEARQRQDYLEQKTTIVNSWIEGLPGIKTAADFGANEGQFSYLLSKQNIKVISTDFDHIAVNNLYKKIMADQDKNILPLLLDIANPSPSIGVNNTERISFIERTRTDLSFALALIHHLAIGKNIPFEKMVTLFSTITKYLIIEFVPKRDEKVQYMLRQKKDIYDDYTEECFLNAFEKRFQILDRKMVPGTERTLFLLKKAD